MVDPFNIMLYKPPTGQNLYNKTLQIKKSDKEEYTDILFPALGIVSCTVDGKLFLWDW